MLGGNFAPGELEISGFGADGVNVARTTGIQPIRAADPVYALDLENGVGINEVEVDEGGTCRMLSLPHCDGIFTGR